MAANKAIVTHLTALQEIASMDILCSDKVSEKKKKKKKKKKSACRQRHISLPSTTAYMMVTAH